MAKIPCGVVVAPSVGLTYVNTPSPFLGGLRLATQNFRSKFKILAKISRGFVVGSVGLLGVGNYTVVALVALRLATQNFRSKLKFRRKFRNN